MITRRSRSLLKTCTAIALFCAVVDASAQQAAPAQEDTTLRPIVLKGKSGKPGNAAADTPLASTTTADQIAKKEINNLTDLGNTTEPGVDFVENKPGKVGGLFIRGLGGARVVTLVDNIPIAHFENFVRSGSFSATTGVSDGSSSFDFNSLSTVDVVKGADSSRIGPGTLGGALVLRTLEPEDLIPEGRDWGGVAKLTFDSADKSFGGSAAVAKKIENTSFLFQGAYKKGHERENKGSNGAIGINRTEANPAEFDQNNLLFKLRQDIEGGHRIGFTAERFDLQQDTELKTLSGTGLTDFNPNNYNGNDDTRRERVSLDYEFESLSDDSFIDAAALTFYWQRLAKEVGSEGTRNNTAYYMRNNSMEESSFGLTGNAYSQFETGNFDHRVSFGGSIQRFHTEQYLAGAPASVSVNKSDMPDIEGVRAGFYVDDRIEFNKSGFALTPGIRFDWFDYEPQSTSTFTGTMPVDKDGFRASPKVLATYQLTPEVELFGQWAMAYRAPTINELYLNFGTGYSVLGNPNLKPETGHGFEIGANYESGDLSGKLTLFHNRYRNFIEFYGSFPTFSYRNLSKVEISGVEIKARKNFANGFYVNGSLAYAYGEDKETGEVLRSVAPLKSIIGVGYEQEDWGVDFSAILSAAARKDGPQTAVTGGAPYQTFDAPGYGIFNLSGWWEPEQVKGMRIQAGIYNIFDKTYYNAVATRDVNTTSTSTSNQPPAFYSEPGRTFKISLTQKF